MTKDEVFHTILYLSMPESRKSEARTDSKLRGHGARLAHLALVVDGVQHRARSVQHYGAQTPTQSLH
jgi:hypothetical protein